MTLVLSNNCPDSQTRVHNQIPQKITTVINVESFSKSINEVNSKDLNFKLKLIV